MYKYRVKRNSTFLQVDLAWKRHLRQLARDIFKMWTRSLFFISKPWIEKTGRPAEVVRTRFRYRRWYQLEDVRPDTSSKQAIRVLMYTCGSYLPFIRRQSQIFMYAQYCSLKKGCHILRIINPHFATASYIKFSLLLVGIDVCLRSHTRCSKGCGHRGKCWNYVICSPADIFNCYCPVMACSGRPLRPINCFTLCYEVLYNISFNYVCIRSLNIKFVI
jgi:hypothetical protein